MSERLGSPYFRVGETIPVSGIYRAFHVGHRVSHDLTLLADNTFPRCNKCGEEVHFELLAEATHVEQDPNFRALRLFEIPHPEMEKA